MGKEQTGMRVPNFVVKAAIKMVQSSVMKRAKMDINKLKPIENVDKCVACVRCCSMRAAVSFRHQCSDPALSRADVQCLVSRPFALSFASLCAAVVLAIARFQPRSDHRGVPRAGRSYPRCSVTDAATTSLASTTARKCAPRVQVLRRVFCAIVCVVSLCVRVRRVGICLRAYVDWGAVRFL